MYGMGMVKGLTITLKNLVLPSRMFTVHQYPDRKIGLIGLAKMAETNPISYVFKEPTMAFKAIVGLASVPDRMPQHSRFREGVGQKKLERPVPTPSPLANMYAEAD